MTSVELADHLVTLGIPVSYGSLKVDTKPPFIVYQFAYSADIFADNVNLISSEIYQIELYTGIKDLALESRVQDLLKSIVLPYQKIGAYLEEERMWQIIYEVQLIN